MSSFLKNPYVVLVSRYLLGVVFIIASIDKIFFVEAFAANIEAYKMVPYPIVNLLALIIPWLELICGILLIGGVYVRGSALILTALLGIFTAAIISALMRGLEIDCGCFGKDHATPVSWTKVAEDLGLMVLGVYIIVRSRKDLTEVPDTVASSDARG